jgi:hypothetical protein
MADNGCYQETAKCRKESGLETMGRALGCRRGHDKQLFAQLNINVDGRVSGE